MCISAKHIVANYFSKYNQDQISILDLSKNLYNVRKTLLKKGLQVDFDFKGTPSVYTWSNDIYDRIWTHQSCRHLTISGDVITVTQEGRSYFNKKHLDQKVNQDLSVKEKNAMEKALLKYAA